MSEEIMTRTVKEQIFGQSYALSGELDEAYMQRLASYVDEKMQMIASTATVDTEKAAVLAAVAIADDQHCVRAKKGEQAEWLKEQAARCLTLVERALKQSE